MRVVRQRLLMVKRRRLVVILMLLLMVKRRRLMVILMLILFHDLQGPRRRLRLPSR